MSWKCSHQYWQLGQVWFHVFEHALDPKARRFYEVGAWGRSWQLWPPAHVLDYETEWTVRTEPELVKLAAWCLKRLESDRRLRMRERGALPDENQGG